MYTCRPRCYTPHRDDIDIAFDSQDRTCHSHILHNKTSTYLHHRLIVVASSIVFYRSYPRVHSRVLAHKVTYLLTIMTSYLQFLRSRPKSHQCCANLQSVCRSRTSWIFQLFFSHFPGIMSMFVVFCCRPFCERDPAIVVLLSSSQNDFKCFHPCSVSELLIFYYHSRDYSV